MKKNELIKHFQIGTSEWSITVKYCLIIDLIIGLIGGVVILLNVL